MFYPAWCIKDLASDGHLEARRLAAETYEPDKATPQ